MDVQQYIKNQLQSCGTYQRQPQDQRSLDSLGLENYIISKIKTKKFRKWSIDTQLAQRIKDSVKNSLHQRGPINFILPFGGYKLWRLPTAPDVDWAEFFTLCHLCQYVSPIAESYKPGATITFLSDDIIIETMDNIPRVHITQYLRSFQNLLQIFQSHLPSNINLQLTRVSDLYKKEEFEMEISMLYQQIGSEMINWKESRKKSLYENAKLNVMWDGEKNLLDITPEKRQKFLKRGVILHEAYRHSNVKYHMENSPNRIPLATKPTSRPSIVVGSTKNSACRFWTGLGVLEEKGGALTSRVLSYGQFLKLQQETCQKHKVALKELENMPDLLIYPSAAIKKSIV